MFNDVLKIVLKWKRHFAKVNCNNCTVHLGLCFCFVVCFGFLVGAGMLRNFISDSLVSKLLVKYKINWV